MIVVDSCACSSICISGVSPQIYIFEAVDWRLVDLMTATEFPSILLAETNNLTAWQVDEPDGETTYHLELNQVTLHFFREEWDEFLELVLSIRSE